MLKYELIALAAIIAILLLIGGCFNACTAGEWNGGECIKCDVHYELRGVSKNIKYYSCPKCGNEVQRYNFTW